MEKQHTIAEPVTVTGHGLICGESTSATFRPAPANHGLVFVRQDMNGIRIPANVHHVIHRERRTTLKNGEAIVDTCEHCLSATAGLKIDNLLIELDGPELPGLDGSAKPYVDAFQSAGRIACDAPRRRLVVHEPVAVHRDGAVVAAVPCAEPELQVLYELDYGPQTSLGRQLCVFDFTNGNFVHEIAPARTYVLEEEARALHERGLGKHLGPDQVLVIGQSGPLGNNAFRFDNEPVRHKIMDLVGDLYLLGMPIQGRIIAYKSGHALNHDLVRELTKQWHSQQRRDLVAHANAIDIRHLSRILPHRYPMLLVDRVVEIDSDQRAVGIKNVTINEPFFQGHYPGTPIMPGVLVVEAMAQLSGVLIGQNLEHTGKLAVLVSLDRVKLRKPVTPGDQLILEVEAIRVRSRTAHMRCHAYVGEELAAEAEVKFMLVDDEQG